MEIAVPITVKARAFKRHAKKKHIARDLRRFAKLSARNGDVISAESDGTLPVNKVGVSNEFDGPFRSNIRQFVMRYGGEMPLPPVMCRESVAPYLMAWLIVLQFNCGGQVAMHVVEEDVRRSKTVFCENCRVAGWGGHPVCGKRYHFLIQNESSIQSSHQNCPYCGSLLHSSDLRCNSCNYIITVDDLEYRAYLKLHDSSHLLHGLVHANGYGHLLQVNGQEGGSQFLTGTDIVGFWDRLCMMLRVREVTVTDMSKKYGMEYRLLHAVTTGRPWYGEWGYQFGRGSFALTSEAYHNSVEDLSNIPLSLFFSHARLPRTPLQDIIFLYWSLSDRQLLTVRDLFCFVIQLLRDANGEKNAGKDAGRIQSEACQGVLCPWTKADVERAEDALIKVLRAIHGSQWVTWRSLRGATCRAVESPELLDYCLKTLVGRIIDDGLVVAVRCNPETSCIEYRLEVDSKQACDAQSLSLCRPTRDHLLRDLRFLYDALLNPATMQHYKPEARRESALNSATNLLDCKQFAKHYDEVAHDLSKLRIWCNIELVDPQKENIVPPAELLVLPVNATIASLEREASKAFQETYLILQRFQAEQLVGFENVSHCTPVMLLLGLNGTIKVRGRCLGSDRTLGHFRMEGGTEMWIVDCICGTKDDDGERMLACDSCNVWQHTRCNGIGAHEEVPDTFVCMKCMILKRKTHSGGGRGGHDGGRRYEDGIPHELICKDKLASSLMETKTSLYGRSCKDEIAATELIWEDKLASSLMETKTSFHGRSCKDEIAATELICEDKLAPSITETKTSLHGRNCKDEIAEQELIWEDKIKGTTFHGRSCKGMIAVQELIWEDKMKPSIKEAGGTFHGSCKDMITAQELICKDKIKPSIMEVATTFPGRSCKDEKDVSPFNEAGSLMCMIAVDVTCSVKCIDCR